jgi:hypothetical protein
LVVMRLALGPFALLLHASLPARFTCAFDWIPRTDPQLFFGIALILIALSALPFRQTCLPYGFD